MPKWARRLIEQVLERDGGLCILCGRLAVDVHHIIPKGRAPKKSKKLWRIENLCCLCRACHSDGQTVWMRVKLLKRMIELYAYDMAWATEFVGAWEER